MENPQIFTYILISTEDLKVSEKQYKQFLEDVATHTTKHDFAQMIHVANIEVKKFNFKDKEYMALFIPFHKERFEDFTALNWYLKTLSAKCNLVMFQLVMPDGSLMGM